MILQQQSGVETTLQHGFCVFSGTFVSNFRLHHSIEDLYTSIYGLPRRHAVGPSVKPKRQPQVNNKPASRFECLFNIDCGQFRVSRKSNFLAAWHYGMEMGESDPHVLQVVTGKTSFDQSVRMRPAQTSLCRTIFAQTSLETLKMMRQQKQAFVPMNLHQICHLN